MAIVRYKLENNIALEPPDRIEDLTDDDGDGVIYLGWCRLGSNITENTEDWRIAKITISDLGTIALKEWAGGLIDYIYKWTDKTGLSYSNLKRI